MPNQKLALMFLAALAPAWGGPATFHKDVEPILQRSCQSCHRPGQIGPMSFLTYAETRPWAKAIKSAVATGKMPPWFADAPKGHFQNDWRLTDGDKQRILDWVDAGAPAGDPSDAPKPITFPEQWTFGQPDRIIEMPRPFDVPAKGSVDYQWVVVPLGLPEDRWVTAYEVQPGDRSVVHHVIAFLRAPGSKWLADATPGIPVPKGSQESEGGQASGLIAGYVPGFPGTAFPDGYAQKIPAGSDIVLQLHYTTNGKAVQDRTRIGLHFSKTPPRMEITSYDTATSKFAIPPGAENHRVTAQRTVKEEVELLGLTPHMHLRGRAMNVFLLHPDGSRSELLRLPKWDFNWQFEYRPAARTLLQPGQKVFVEAFYDNSPNNPHNPDPTKEVRWGDQTWDEMMFCGVLTARPYNPNRTAVPTPSPYVAKPATAGR